MEIISQEEAIQFVSSTFEKLNRNYFIEPQRADESINTAFK